MPNPEKPHADASPQEKQIATSDSSPSSSRSSTPDTKKQLPSPGIDTIGDLSEITKGLAWLGSKFSPWTKSESSSSNQPSKPDVEKKPGSQDEIYRLLKIKPISPPHPGTPNPEHRKSSVETELPLLFTNEKQTKLIKELSDHEEHVVISGSGDIILNLFTIDSTKKVKAVDISDLACEFSEVKLAALEHLDYNEFLNFFNPKDKETFFAHSQYEKLKLSLSQHAKDRFGKLIHPQGNSDALSIGRMFSFPDVDILKRNPYLLSQEDYEKAQSNYRKAKKENPRPVTFYPQTITEFLGRDIKTDHIYLSNIFAYEPYFDDVENKTRVGKVIPEIKKAQGKLNLNGQISIYYRGDDPIPHVRLIANLLNQRYPNDQMNAKIIKGKHNDKGDKYGILLLTKPADN